jgi:RNA polymerase sigma-70 factor (ECF subfamily)
MCAGAATRSSARSWRGEPRVAWSGMPGPEPSPRLSDAQALPAPGDRAAFAALHRRYAPVVHGILFSRVGPDHADDLTQEVFLAVYRKIGQVRDAAALPGWIATVARNAANDHHRRRGRSPRREPLAEVAAPEAAGEGDLARLRARVLALLGTLPEAYRETLVLRLVEGLTGPEIAARTGMTPGSVRVNLARGLSLLRPLLEKEGWR